MLKAEKDSPLHQKKDFSANFKPFFGLLGLIFHFFSLSLRMYYRCQ